MKKTVTILIACIMSLSVAHAETYTYMCRVPSDHKSYPLKLDIDNATLTWRDKTFRNLKQVEGCRYKYQATRAGMTAELCTATKGVADLKLGNASFDCQMK
jgi:hypothetical protein